MSTTRKHILHQISVNLFGLRDKIKKIRLLFNLQIVNVENDYQEYLLRVPVVIYKGKVLDEGQVSLITIFKKLIFRI